MSERSYLGRTAQEGCPSIPSYAVDSKLEEIPTFCPNNLNRASTGGEDNPVNTYRAQIPQGVCVANKGQYVKSVRPAKSHFVSRKSCPTLYSRVSFEGVSHDTSIPPSNMLYSVSNASRKKESISRHLHATTGFHNQPSHNSTGSPNTNESTSYYIFSPGRFDSAHYVYRHKEDHNEGSVLFDSVPVTFGRSQSGHRGYFIAISNNDDSRNHIHDRASSWPLQPMEQCTRKSVPAVILPINRARLGQGSICQRHLVSERGFPTGAYGILPSHVFRKEEVQLLTNNVYSRFLRSRSQYGSRYSTYPTKIQGSRLTEIKSMNKEVIRELVEMTLYETSRITSRRAGENSTANLDLLAFDKQSNSIRPRPSVAIDPATTISIPRPSFSGLGSQNSQPVTNSWGTLQSTTSTVVSRQSITEITWVENGGKIGGRRSSSLSSDSTSATLQTSWSQSSPKGTSFHVEAEAIRGSLDWFSSPLRPTYGEKRNSSMQSGKTVIASQITSFPQLRSRHCTNDWIKPPAKVDEPNESIANNLYLQGVDAHCGGNSNPAFLDLGMQEKLKEPWSCNLSLLNDGPGQSTEEIWQGHDLSDDSPVITAKNDAGVFIGTTAHRHHSADLIDASVDSNNGFFPSILNKIRQSSQRVMYPLFNAQNFESLVISTPHSFLVDSAQAQSELGLRHGCERGNMSRLSDFDVAGTYRAVARGRRIEKRRRKTCSEDNRPHICENDLDNLKSNFGAC